MHTESQLHVSVPSPGPDVDRSPLSSTSSLNRMTWPASSGIGMDTSRDQGCQQLIAQVHVGNTELISILSCSISFEKREEPSNTGRPGVNTPWTRRPLIVLLVDVSGEVPTMMARRTPTMRNVEASIACTGTK